MTRTIITIRDTTANFQRLSAASYHAVEKYRANPADVSRCGQLVHHHQIKHANHAFTARAFLWSAIAGRDHLEMEDLPE